MRLRAHRRIYNLKVTPLWQESKEEIVSAVTKTGIPVTFLTFPERRRINLVI